MGVRGGGASGALLGVRVCLAGGPQQTEVQALLSRRGVDVRVSVPTTAQAASVQHIAALLDVLCGRDVDAVVFADADVVRALWTVAAEQGRRQDLQDALRDHVVVACADARSGDALAAHGIGATVDGAGAPAVVDALATRLPRASSAALSGLVVAGRRVDMFGAVLLLDGEPVSLSRAPRAVLEALAERPGEVWSRRQLLPRLPSGSARSEHAVEMAVARIRVVLGASSVETVVKRGYRLKAAPTPG